MNLEMKKLLDRLLSDFDENDLDTCYWTDGKKVFHRLDQLKGADYNTFELIIPSGAK